MKKILLITGIILFMTGCSNKKGSFVVTVASQNDVPTAVNKLKEVIKKKELTLFSIIDHAENAKSVKMRLKPETVVLFGNPKAGTLLMECNPSIGLDLPLKMLFSTSYEGKTTISYTNPEYWTLKHNIKDKKCLTLINKMNIAMQKIAEAVSK